MKSRSLETSFANTLLPAVEWNTAAGCDTHLTDVPRFVAGARLHFVVCAPFDVADRLWFRDNLPLHGLQVRQGHVDDADGADDDDSDDDDEDDVDDDDDD